MLFGKKGTQELESNLWKLIGMRTGDFEGEDAWNSFTALRKKFDDLQVRINRC